MTAGPSIDPEQFLHEQLAQASPDLLRDMLETFINTLLSAQADSVCGAEYAVRSRLGPTAATGTGTGTWTLGSGRWMWRCRSCGRVRSSRTGCCSAAGGRRPR